MEDSEIKSQYHFLENTGAYGVDELEAKLSAQLRDLCERNAHLSKRNADLRQSAEIGWNTEIQIKKFSLIEADLNDEIKSLRFERETLSQQIGDREVKIARLQDSVKAQSADIVGLQKKIKNLASESSRQSELEGEIRELRASLMQSRANEENLIKVSDVLVDKQNSAIAELQSRQIEVMNLAQENFKNKLSEMESAYSALRAKCDTLQNTVTCARAEEALLREEIAVTQATSEEAISEMQELHEQQLSAAQASFHSQLTELGQLVWKANGEAKEFSEAFKNAQAENIRLSQLLTGQEETFRAQLTELAETGWESEREARETRKAQIEISEELKRQTANFAKTNNELRRQLDSEREAVSKLKAKEILARHEAEQAESRAKTAAQSFNQAMQLKEQELAAARDTKSVLEMRTTEQKSTIASMSNELNLKIRELKESQTMVQKQVTVIGEQSHALQDKMAEAGGLRFRMEALQSQIGSQTETIRARDTEIMQLSAVVERQLVTLSNITKQDKEKDLEIRRFRFTETSLSESVNELRRAGLERDELRKEFETLLCRMNGQIEAMTLSHSEAASASAQEIVSLNTQLQMARAQIENLREANEQIRTERDAARENLKIERDSADQLLSLKDQNTQTERNELEAVSAQIRQREYQLRQYAANVSDEKAEVLRRAKQLADEIRAATTLAPLKDYLSFTEFELSKLETQLRKTPVISVERPRLEAAFTQMTEQRDFLRSAIVNSQRQLDHQAAQLLKIARPEKLTPVPPMPPRKTSV